MIDEAVGTGKFTELAPLDAPPPPPRRLGDLLKSIFGTKRSRDDIPNPQLEPARSIAFLCFYVNGRFVGSATGFFVKPDVVVTAAHNILMAKPTAVGAFAGYDAKRNPVQSVSASRWAWDAQRDFAVLITAPSPASGLQLNGRPTAKVTLAGYAFGYFGQLTAGVGAAKTSGDKLLYALPADKGDSGGPIFAGAFPTAVVVALHTDSFDTGNPFEAGGELADQQMIARIASLEAQART
ncbi:MULTISPECIES: trypsin-like serine peptidase [Sphingomonadales]|jgi:hypothetical protein|uniref:Serine protease n=2 Tax=Sphingomonadaceae TaxID=41297 RepID=A0A397PDP9_9SPHN|nr:MULTISPECIES: serine protease [Sphingomonadaceae]EKU73305.1 hypothetical protein HMPREF9718_03774 [Sphingobium yanoikuyae ATCC 51230]RIA46059.1 V8-like Glu-specific endopeptidase [Hephaestia caeni]WQE08086.1 serine protease [Sphingobium yanoikuyae]